MNVAAKLTIDNRSTFNIGQSTLHAHSVIDVRGTHNIVEIGDNVQGRILISIMGANSKVIIKDNVKIMGTLDIVIRRGQGNVVIGQDSTFQGLVRLYNHEPSRIEIGADCMFAGDILATTSDMHAIFDADDVRINPAEPIIIGDHVWVAVAAKLLKGVTIGSGSIVGMSALVTRGTYPDQCMLVGVPAKVVRENVHWTRAIP